MSKGKTPQPRPQRQAVLIVVEADGFTRVYGADNLDVYIANVPASGRGMEDTAEHIAELLMPRRYREMFREDRLRAVGIARRMSPAALAEARRTALSISQLNRAAGGDR